MFGRATITLGIGSHSSSVLFYPKRPFQTSYLSQECLCELRLVIELFTHSFISAVNLLQPILAVLSLSYYESDIAIESISQRLPHIVAKKTASIDMV